MFSIGPHFLSHYTLANVVLLSLIKVSHRRHISFYFATSYLSKGDSSIGEYPMFPQKKKKLVMNRRRGGEYSRR
jgi:hypothetical protein